MGIRTRKGHPDVKSKVQKILSNPFCIGINRFNGKDYPGVQTPIISKELFEQVQSKMHRDRPRCHEKHYCALKGIIRCTDCSTMVTWQLQKDRYYGACRRDSDGCKQGKLLREDAVEDMLVDMLQKLVCPSPEIIDWVADAMRSQYRKSIEKREKLVATIQSRIDLIKRMEEILYDDKISDEISAERYAAKKAGLQKQLATLEAEYERLESDQTGQLEQRVFLLKLTQNAAKIYPTRTPEQKRLLISKLFSSMTYTKYGVSVTYTKFAEAIAKRAIKTQALLGGKI